MKKRILVIFLSMIVVGFLVFDFNSSTEPQFKNIQKFTSRLTDPTPTPFPFQELTIPYLRGREYDSSLGEMQLLSKKQSYSEYLTSYDSDGFKVNGLLTIPNESSPQEGWPAIVFVHGYIPPSLYKTTEKYTAYVDSLAKNGFVVFKIDLRGHGDSEGEAGGAYYSSDYVIDTLNARSALQSLESIDSQNIGLWGHSMAGNVVFRSLVVAQDIPAAVIWAGAVYSYEDFQEFRISDNSYRPPTDTSNRKRKRDELFAEYGEFDSQSSFWKQVAPTNYLDGVQSALQIHHAINDSVVDIGYSKNLSLILDGTDIPHELFEYSNGGHNIEGASFSSAMERTIEFYKKNLSE